MKLSKVRQVKTPTRGTKKSAGIDFYVPEDFEKKSMWIGDSIVIKSGIKVKLPKCTAFVGFNKSGVAVKKGLQIGACVIDEDYQGEIHIHLTKVNGEPVSIEPGEKIAQFILIPVYYARIEEVEVEYLYPEISERGEGAFGSTGVK